MKRWHEDGSVTLYHGDALETLRGLPDASVQMVVSSPPFWGLRDYGTGRWDGGDADCDHLKTPNARASSGLRNDGREHKGPYEGEKATRTGTPYTDVCGKCGGRRVDQQIGLEDDPQTWCDRLVAVYRECRRVLRDDGVMFIEIGDSYAGAGPQRRDTGPSEWGTRGGKDGPASRDRRSNEIKSKDLVGAPWMLAFALRNDGWYLRADCIWSRPNPMPESVTDRPTKSHSYVFVLTKRARYFWDSDAVRESAGDSNASRIAAKERNPGVIGERVPNVVDADNPHYSQLAHRGVHGVGTQFTQSAPGRNLRSVWEIATEPTPFSHFATFPQRLVERCIRAATSEYGACAACGAPWRRITEREAVPHPNGGHQGRNAKGDARGMTDMSMNPRFNWRVSTAGWEPSCACNGEFVTIEKEHLADDGTYLGSETIRVYQPRIPLADHPREPCQVLDPFMGSGTTALVARRLRRRAIGIELNHEYLEIARRRLALPDEDGAVEIGGHDQLALDW
jgi:DNA modification methylase